MNATVNTTVNVTLIAVAAAWGAGVGWLMPRPTYRLAVEPDQPWRTRCPAGHAMAGVWGGWFGPARCRGCDAAAGHARPTVTALVTAFVCAALAAATGPRPELVVWLLLAPIAVLLCLVDLAVHRLPDVLTLPLAGAAVVLLGPASLVPGHAGAWPAALLGGLALGGGYGVLFLINPAGLGFGDVKLALGLGVMLGWYGLPCLLTGALLGLVLGALYGLGLLLLRRASRKEAFPLGPFLTAGAFCGLLLGAATA